MKIDDDGMYNWKHGPAVKPTLWPLPEMEQTVLVLSRPPTQKIREGTRGTQGTCKNGIFETCGETFGEQKRCPQILSSNLQRWNPTLGLEAWRDCKFQNLTSDWQSFQGITGHLSSLFLKKTRAAKHEAREAREARKAQSHACIMQYFGSEESMEPCPFRWKIEIRFVQFVQSTKIWMLQELSL